MFHLSRFLVHVVSGIFLVLVSAVLGYFVIYGFTFSHANNIFQSVSNLKNQIINQEKVSDPKDQLRSMGYQFRDDNFYSLNSSSSKSYHANVLDGYEPVQVTDGKNIKSNGYYFYDEKGEAYYVLIHDQKSIAPSDIIPLNRE